MNTLTLKIVGLVLSILMIANFILFFLQKITSLTFWIITALGAIVAWGVLPKLKNQTTHT